MAKDKAVVTNSENPQRLIYCGPNIPSGILQRHTIYKGGLPEHLEKVFSDCPAVKALFVPIADLAKTEKAISSKGSAENVLFSEVLQFTLKGGK